MAAIFHMILLHPRAIRGPGKPRIIQPYQAFHCPLDFLLSGPGVPLMRSKRLMPVDDYLESLVGFTIDQLRRECVAHGLDLSGDRSDILDRIMSAVTGAQAEEKECGLDFRGLQKALKALGKSAAGTEEELRARYEEAQQ